MANYKINDRVNTPSLNDVTIKGIHVINTSEGEITGYIIEHETGWVPCVSRINLFDLDETKKYLFVLESELTLISE